MNCIRETARYMLQEPWEMSYYVLRQLPTLLADLNISRDYCLVAAWEEISVAHVDLNRGSVHLTGPYPDGFHAWRNIE